MEFLEELNNEDDNLKNLQKVKVFVLVRVHKIKVKMVVDLYYAPASPPCRTVLLAAKAIGVDLNLKELGSAKRRTHYSRIS
ncbi:hypothetical protein NQ317_012233 [Molorchus minor]|uniref:Uncharacterized protein n=1 Tax=Molorchus minor TaxID=1323400 RepID=A0ABQ9IQC2_9CUCU|nr:hypothetical protein NQ317_012233 [Molorchus minor]